MSTKYTWSSNELSKYRHKILIYVFIISAEVLHVHHIINYRAPLLIIVQKLISVFLTFWIRVYFCNKILWIHLKYHKFCLMEFHIDLFKVKKSTYQFLNVYTHNQLKVVLSKRNTSYVYNEVIDQY